MYFAEMSYCIFVFPFERWVDYQDRTKAVANFTAKELLVRIELEYRITELQGKVVAQFAQIRLTEDAAAGRFP